MRGLVQPEGRDHPRPIQGQLREGLTVLEYFIATHGARKGLAEHGAAEGRIGYPPTAGRRLPGRSSSARRDAAPARVMIAGSRARSGRSLVKEVHVETGVYARVLAEDCGRRAGKSRGRAGQGTRRRLHRPAGRRGHLPGQVRCVTHLESKMGTAHLYGRSMATASCDVR